MQMDNPIKQSKSWKMTNVSGFLLFKDIYKNISVLLQKHRGILYMCANRKLSGWMLLWRRRQRKGQAQLAVIRIFLKCSIFQNNYTPNLDFNHSDVFFFLLCWLLIIFIFFSYFFSVNFILPCILSFLSSVDSLVIEPQRISVATLSTLYIKLCIYRWHKSFNKPCRGTKETNGRIKTSRTVHYGLEYSKVIIYLDEKALCNQYSRIKNLHLKKQNKTPSPGIHTRAHSPRSITRGQPGPKDSS